MESSNGTLQTGPRTDWLLDLGPGDYQMCKEALHKVAAGEPSVTRIFGAFMYGGRDVWRIVVQLWEQAEQEVGGEIAHLTAWEDGTMTVWEGSLERYQTDYEDQPLPWEIKVAPDK